MSNIKEINSSEITRSSLLAKNTLWNTLGLVLPLLVGVLTLPILIHELGTERFGVLSIAWMIIGYFSIFDLGLGRALTKLISESLGKDKHKEIPSMFWTGMIIMLSTGVIGTIVLGLCAERIVFFWLNIDPLLQQESLNSIYILSFSIPFVIATAGFRAVLEAYQKFSFINIIRVPLGLVTFLGPLAVLPFSKSLDIIVVTLLIGRILGVFAYYICCMRTVPAIRKEIDFDKQKVRPLLSFGGWMTVSNVIGPLMVYLDRFLIGSVLTMTAVSYYVVPYEIVTKFWMIPMGLIGVLFPAFSTMLISDRDKAVVVFSKGINIIFYLMFPVFLTINLFTFEGLTIWLGGEFAEKSTFIMQLLSIGVFVNCVSRMPLIMIQSAGRPDLITKIFLLELLPYIFALWLSLDFYGVDGAAVVWMIRVLIDTIAMFIFCSKTIPEVSKLSMVIIGKLSIAVSILFFVTFTPELMMKIGLFFILIILNVLLAWKFVFPLNKR